MRRISVLIFLLSCASHWGSAQVNPAVLTAPASGATNIQSPISLQWAPVANATAYYLYIGHSPGVADVVDSGEIQATSFSVPLPSGQYFVRLWTKAAYWVYSDSNFTVSNAFAQLSFPSNGSSNVVPNPVTLSWNSASGAVSYYLYVGSAPGLSDVVDSGEITSLQYTAGLPVNKILYVRLWTHTPWAWMFSDSSFTTGTPVAVLNYPVNDAKDVDPGLPFQWTAVADGISYSLTIGTSLGSSDVFASGETAASQVQVPNLISGTRYFARLGTKKTSGWEYVDSEFVAGDRLARLTHPLDHGSMIDPSVPFTWNAVPNAQAYYLYIGTSPGAVDVYDSGELTGTRILPSHLSVGVTYYARLWTKNAGIWKFADSTFTASSGLAKIIYPADQNQHATTEIPFSWSPVPTAQAYYLYIGTVPGAVDVFDSGELLETSQTVSGLQDGKPYYIRLWTKRDGVWGFTDSSFVADAKLAQLITPTDKQTEVDPRAAMSWTVIANAQAYYLYLGNSLGARDVWETGETQATTIAPLYLLPQHTYYARLHTKIAGIWQHVDTTFSTSSGNSQLIYPVDTQIDVNSFPTITWTGPPGATNVWFDLFVGTSKGGRDVYDSGFIQAAEAQPYGLIPNQLYYARLWTNAYGQWQYTDISFSTGQNLGALAPLTTASLHEAVAAATNTVRGMADRSNVPIPGSDLDFDVRATGAQVATCLNYSRVLTRTLIAEGIPARVRAITLDGTTFEAHAVTEYYDTFNDRWSVADATFGVIYIDANSGLGQSVEQLNHYVAAGDLTSIFPVFVTASGDAYLRGYYMDPITLYLNIYSPGGVLSGFNGSAGNLPTENPPDQYLSEHGIGTVAGTHGLYLLHFQQPTDVLEVNYPDGSSAHIAAVDNTNWSKATFFSDGWMPTSIPAGMQLYTFERVLF